MLKSELVAFLPKSLSMSGRLFRNTYIDVSATHGVSGMAHNFDGGLKTFNALWNLDKRASLLWAL